MDRACPSAWRCEWNVEEDGRGLAHCGGCHTPRNKLGAEDRDRLYDGAWTEGWYAPPLNATSPAAQPWSAGPPLPDFTGQQQSAAEQWAQANGVSLNEQPAPKSDQPQGTIVRQSPAPGTPVAKGEVITVYISPGPPNVPVPNVDGEGVLQAYHRLRALGFQVTTQQAGPFGKTVFNYSPAGQAPKGSTITIYYGLPSIGGGG